MIIPIIQTKLHRPKIKQNLVCRQRLHEVLDRGLDGPLTLVSAPAGYGKSMIVSHWLESRAEANAWLSLGESDNDLRPFLTYVVAAVQSAVPGACSGLKAALRSPTLPVPQEFTGDLVNELDAITEPFILVLDDYHLVDSPGIRDLIGGFLDHPPRQFHLVLITRRDPALPLSRMLADGSLTEIRMADLTFNRSETELLLKKSTGISASSESLLNLENEMEGWVAGLHLVSLVLADQTDPDRFLSGLHGGLREVQDYLLGEVLAKQPPVVQDWLLKSSILERFCAPLCEAVCSSEDEPWNTGLDGQTFLRVLAQSNLFCISLDEQDEWCRFHHLFQWLLQRQLNRRLNSGEIAELHTRASRWFESQDQVAAAIRHKIVSGHPEDAAEILGRNLKAKLDLDHWYEIESWLSEFPQEFKQDHPGLLLAEGWVAFFRFELERLYPILERLESFPEDVLIDPWFAGSVSFFRGNFEYWSGAGETSLASFEKSLRQLPEERGAVRGNVQLFVALARTMSGMKDLAVRSLTDQLRAVDATEDLYQVDLIAALGMIYQVTGELGPARAEARRMQTMTRKLDNVNTAAWGAWAHGTVCLHAFDLVQATEDFKTAVRQPYQLELRASADAQAGLALAQQLMGDSDAARVTVENLAGFARMLPDPQWTTLAGSCQARIALLRGDLHQASQWAHENHGEPTPDSLHMWLEVPCITKARILIAIGSKKSLGEADELIGGMSAIAADCHFTSIQIELAALKALSLDAGGHFDEAVQAMGEALDLAGPRGWVRPFVEAGPPMAELLKAAIRQGIATEYAQAILAAFGASASGPTAKTGQMAEPLTIREDEILDLLQQRLRDKEIAERLCISAETVKFHLRNIYQKLGVGGRRQAVQKARELGLLLSS